MKTMKQLITTILFIYVIINNFHAQSTWDITANNINPNQYFGVTVANGMVGLVSDPVPMHIKDVVLNGVFDRYQRGRVSNILKSFNALNLDIIANGTFLNGQNIQNYTQTLDMQHAVFRTTFETDDIKVEHEMLALRHLPYTAMVNVKVSAKKNTAIEFINNLEAPNHLADVRNYYSEIDRPHVHIPLLTSVAKSPSGAVTVASSNSYIFQEAHGQEPHLIHEDWDFNRHLVKFKKEIKSGQTYEFSMVGSACTSVDFTDPQNEAERLSIYAKLEGKDRLMQRHKAAWNDLWKSDIVIEGDDKAQRDMRFMIYHLYSFAREGTSLSLSPMGLSGLGYNGHVFWDTELWMYPPLLVLQPDIARSLLDYRFERLEAAKQNAFSHGYKGAMFPWESADDGTEQTPVWALTGPFQHHITGCIAWSFWKYYQVTGDKVWLKEKGWPVIEAAADFWTSRVERNGEGQYDIKNVIGANEFEENIDNNAFTNGMAITTLNYATEAAQVLGYTADPDWAHVAKNIPLLQFADGTTRENATYNGAEIKQADVNLLAHPLEIITDKEQIKKDLAYYEPRMSPDGPAMGTSVLATLHAQLGNTEKAYDLFKFSYETHGVPPFGVLSEVSGGRGVAPFFATGAGGTLQSVLFGFGGLDITNEGLVRGQQQLPKQWKSLTITF